MSELRRDRLRFGMNRFLVRRFLYPIHERLRGRKTPALQRELAAHDQLSAEALRQHNENALAKLLDHAFENVPHWREFAAHHELDHKAAPLERLRALPPMDKNLIREHLESLVATNWRAKVFKLATGGSSGQPLIFYTDNARESSQLAAKARAREWFGIHIGDRQVDLWGSPIEISAQDRLRTFKDGLMNYRLLSAFDLSDEAMAQFRQVLIANRTDYLYGYASVLARYAGFLEARGEDLKALNLKGAVCTAELLFPDQAEVIERVFGCPAINEYGCRDGGYIAQSCPEGQMHIASDTLKVEVLGDSGEPLPAGEVGEIAVTNLWSFGMPLIRYKLGDRAALADPEESCACGLPYPMLKNLSGRVTDTLSRPDGRRIHGLALMYVLRVIPGLINYQVIQHAVDRVEVLLVLEDGAEQAAICDEVLAGCREVMGDAVAIKVNVVPHIPPSASGKMRAVWNKMDD